MRRQTHIAINTGFGNFVRELARLFVMVSLVDLLILNTLYLTKLKETDETEVRVTCTTLIGYLGDRSLNIA